MKIAIIGGSIAGLEAAIRLAPKHDVTLYEEHDEIGYPLQCAEGWVRIIEPYGCISKEIRTARIRLSDLNFKVKDEIELDVNGLLVTIDRPKMEKKMAAMAESRGCEIVTGRKVRISELSLRGYDVVVDASGHPSQWCREFGQRKRGAVAIQARCKIEIDDLVMDMVRDIDGYFWVFPKANGEANIGLGFYKKVWQAYPNVTLRQKLDQYIEFVGGKPMWYTGGLLGVGLNKPLVRFYGEMPVVLVGDAAGMVDPFFGEGMTKAVIAARLLAECINSHGLVGISNYERVFLKKLRWHYVVSRIMYEMKKLPFFFKMVKILLPMVQRATRNKQRYLSQRGQLTQEESTCSTGLLNQQ